MPQVSVISEKPITTSEVKELLANIEKKNKELNYRANKTHTHLQEFTKISASKHAELSKKIEGLSIPRMKEEYIVKIVDTLPKHAEEVKALLSGYTFTISQENAKKVAEVVKDYC